jgi:26 proteasome complex subunit DSS1
MSSTSAPQASTAAPAKKELPQLLPLEEDDEFEEFPSEGQLVLISIFECRANLWTDWTDWEEKDTFAASLDKSSKPEGGPKGLDSLWEDNWDDDDVGDDFSVQLRWVQMARAAVDW